MEHSDQPIRYAPRRPLWALACTICIQIISFGAIIAVLELFEKPYYSLQITIAGDCLIAFLLARACKLSLPWQVCNVALGPAIAISLGLSISPHLPLAALIIATAIYIPTFWTHVPFYPTSRKTYDVVLDLLPSDRPFRFIDLGCGFGTMLIYLARHRPLGHFEGVEISPLPYLAARIRAALFGGGRVSIRLKSFWGLPLAPYDFVYAFLAPPPMPKLWEKVRGEMKKDSLFIVNSFPVEAEAEAQTTVVEGREFTIYSYRNR